MLILPLSLTFDWDGGNIDKNYIKHGVSHLEAEEAFLNVPVVLLEDKKHSTGELRYMLWGTTNMGRLLTIIFTMRGDSVRVISARDMNKKERSFYNEYEN